MVSLDADVAVRASFCLAEVVSLDQTVPVEDVCFLAAQLNDALFIPESLHAESTVESLLEDESAELQ